MKPCPLCRSTVHTKLYAGYTLYCDECNHYFKDGESREDFVMDLVKLYDSIPNTASSYHICDILLGYIERRKGER